MERLTIPDKKIDGGLRRAVIDAREVRKEAMTVYWALKKYEDTGLTPQEIVELKERNSEKIIHADKVTRIGKFGNCPRCGRRLRDQDCTTFCGNCGQRLKWER